MIDSQAFIQTRLPKIKSLLLPFPAMINQSARLNESLDRWVRGGGIEIPH